jgi:hypothetical protein
MMDPLWPDPLTFANGGKVTSARDWWNKRRPELVEIFAREIYGRIPASAPKLPWRGVSMTAVIPMHRM